MEEFVPSPKNTKKTTYKKTTPTKIRIMLGFIKTLLTALYVPSATLLNPVAISSDIISYIIRFYKKPLIKIIFSFFLILYNSLNINLIFNELYKINCIIYIIAIMFSDPQSFREDLKSFIVDNGILGTMAGISIGIATRDLISSLVGDIIIPLIIVLLVRLNIKSLTSILPGNGKSTIDITNFIKQFVSWILIIIISFIFIKTAVEKIFGIDSSNKKEVEVEPETKSKSKPKETFMSF